MFVILAIIGAGILYVVINPGTKDPGCLFRTIYYMAGGVLVFLLSIIAIGLLTYPVWHQVK